jgi:hypothetical protein
MSSQEDNQARLPDIIASFDISKNQESIRPHIPPHYQSQPVEVVLRSSQVKDHLDLVVKG